MKKHIVCFGDSNTHGYCPDPTGCAEPRFIRFNEEERWTCLLQQALGEDYLVLEEGLSGRTTVFADPLEPGLCGADYLLPCLKTHAPVSLLLIMLGTNDTKERFSANAVCIARGMERLVRMAKAADFWVPGEKPNILIVSPPPIQPGIAGTDAGLGMGPGCVEKSRGLAPLYEAVAQLTDCHFFDAAGCDFNRFDFMHLSLEGHRQMARAMAELVPTLVSRCK